MSAPAAGQKEQTSSSWGVPGLSGVSVPLPTLPQVNLPNQEQVDSATSLPGVDNVATLTEEQSNDLWHVLSVFFSVDGEPKKDTPPQMAKQPQPKAAEQSNSGGGGWWPFGGGAAAAPAPVPPARVAAPAPVVAPAPVARPAAQAAPVKPVAAVGPAAQSGSEAPLGAARAESQGDLLSALTGFFAFTPQVRPRGVGLGPACCHRVAALCCYAASAPTNPAPGGVHA